jgi:hypothetical protein
MIGRSVSRRVDRTGLLILRVRVAEQHRGARALVATVTTTFDLAERSAEERSVVGSAGEIGVVVRRWIDDFARGAAGDDSVTPS